MGDVSNGGGGFEKGGRERAGVALEDASSPALLDEKVAVEKKKGKGRIEEGQGDSPPFEKSPNLLLVSNVFFFVF